MSLALPARFITELVASVDHYWHRAWGNTASSWQGAAGSQRGQRTGDGGRKSEVRDQMSAVGGDLISDLRLLTSVMNGFNNLSNGQLIRDRRNNGHRQGGVAL